MDVINFKSEPKKTPFAPEWNYYLAEEIIKDVDFKKYIAQESWVVVKGRVRCHFYDLDDSLIKEVDLEAGDCSITLAGGHTYTGLENDTLVREFKTGPYRGQKLDKQFI